MICMRLNAYVWRHQNIERAREAGRTYEATPVAREKRKSAKAAWLEKDESTICSIAHGAKARSKALGVPCDIDPNYCIELFKAQQSRCHWTGAEFILKGPPRHPLKPSLDRIEPSLGYTKGNVVWATNFANRARSDLPADQFRDVLGVITQSLHMLAPF